MGEEIFNIGGPDPERLYLQDLEFQMPDGQKIIVKKTNEPGVDMVDLISRHKARYGLVALFCKPGSKVLDFPCGSGYAADFIKSFGAEYVGVDFDKITIEYGRRVYGDSKVSFQTGDLNNPSLPKETFDIVSCIEGLEHIENRFQQKLIPSLKESLAESGTLIISSPESTRGVSGPNPLNPYHPWELTKADFLELLYSNFESKDVELITYKRILDTGELTTCFFGICHKTG